MTQTGATARLAGAAETWRRRENLWPAVLLLGLTILAWAYTFFRLDAVAGPMTDGRMGGMQMPQDVNRLVDVGLFVLGWGAMMAAMMLPAALPLILLYRTVARKRMPPVRGRVAAAALVVGYLGVWTLAGLPVYAYSALSTSLGAAAPVLPGLLLIAGGVYQFTALKHGCHSRCSNPLMFLAEKWRPGTAGAVRLGVLHGVDCLGCCVGLMLALVALGMMNLALMLTAAVIIFVEKTMPGGHRIAAPLGAVLIIAGLISLALPLWGSSMGV